MRKIPENGDAARPKKGKKVHKKKAAKKKVVHKKAPPARKKGYGKKS